MSVGISGGSVRRRIVAELTRRSINMPWRRCRSPRGARLLGRYSLNGTAVGVVALCAQWREGQKEGLWWTVSGAGVLDVGSGVLWLLSSFQLPGEYGIKRAALGGARSETNQRGWDFPFVLNKRRTYYRHIRLGVFAVIFDGGDW